MHIESLKHAKGLYNLLQLKQWRQPLLNGAIYKIVGMVLWL